jgi:hypothetical protein
MEITEVLNKRGYSLKTIPRLFIIALLLVCSGCVSVLRIDGPYEGKVVDRETNQPIEGAVVHCTWNKVHVTPAGGLGEYYDSYEVLTDSKGEFEIPGKGLLVFSSIDKMDITIFKAGYEQVRPNPWHGFKKYAYGARDIVSWEGDKAIFKLKRLSLEERRNRGITMPLTPAKKQRLMRMESNKEDTEIGRPLNSLYPVE